PRPTNNNFNRPSGNNNSGGGRPQNFNRSAPAPKGPATFEDMLSKFMTSSEDKFTDVKKPSSNRRGGYNKKSSRDYD
ncbi:MAG: RNA-binding protein S1, partial [Oscillospiraceae bacterium]